VGVTVWGGPPVSGPVAARRVVVTSFPVGEVAAAVASAAAAEVEVGSGDDGAAAPLGVWFILVLSCMPVFLLWCDCFWWCLELWKEGKKGTSYGSVFILSFVSQQQQPL